MMLQPAQNAAGPERQLQRFLQTLALELRAGGAPPGSLQEWDSRKQELRNHLRQSWGGFPDQPCALEPQVLDTLERDGYRVEKIVFQTRPGLLMTANAYVPDRSGKLAAVLCVHGHWRGAKQDPVVQSRAIGLAKLGFFALVVDAFGAGERGIGKKLGEYHGELVASTLWPAGLALSGLQVYENMRAVDYLQSRPEVDANRIGITGASGGGNQSMYAGAFDERFAAVVPVCSVGTYQSYLSAAACMCEIVPRALTYTEEWGLLAMVAPRALLVVSASDDAFQFSPGEAAKSVATAKSVFELHGRGDSIKHQVFQSKHDYNRPMREAMYGWMTLHLTGQGDGAPIAEPAFETEDPETLRCFPGETRPENFVTLPAYAAAESRRLLSRRSLPEHQQQCDAEALWMLGALSKTTLGPFPKRTPLKVQASDAGDGVRELTFDPEPGISVSARYHGGKGQRLAIVLHLDGVAAAETTGLPQALQGEGWNVVTADLRNTGRYSTPGDKIGEAVDHTSAQWAMWCGRPMLGQWAFDTSRLLDALESDGKPAADVSLIGIESAGIVAICAAALERRIEQVAAINLPATFVSDRPYKAFRVGVVPPGILRDVGDVAHLAALLAPRKLILASGTTGAGERLDIAAIRREFQYTSRVYAFEKAADKFVVTDSAANGELVRSLGRGALPRE